MTKRDKLEAAIRNNPRQVRFNDLDTLMSRHKFTGDSDKAHVVYTHSVHGDIIVNVAKPHGGAKQVDPFYVRRALDAIDRKKARG